MFDDLRGAADQVEDAMVKQDGVARGLLDAARMLDSTGIAGVSEIGAALRIMAVEMTVHGEEMAKAVRDLHVSLDRSKPGAH